MTKQSAPAREHCLYIPKMTLVSYRLKSLDTKNSQDGQTLASQHLLQSKSKLTQKMFYVTLNPPPPHLSWILVPLNPSTTQVFIRIL